VSGSGHLFIVRADITTFACDGWLVPGDGLGPGESWLARYDFGPERPIPDDLDEVRVAEWSPAEGDPRTPWLVHLAGDESSEIDWYVDGVRRFLEAASASPNRALKRARPLYAVPLVGTGGGGARARSGELTRELVPALCRLAHRFEVDLALCLWTGAHYAAAQEARARVSGDCDAWRALPARLQDDAERLGKIAAGEAGTRLVLFVGAGVSQNAGLPGWGGLLDQLASDLGLSEEQQRDLGDIRDPLARAEATRAVADVDDLELKRAIAELIERYRHPSLCHAILASMSVEEVITTNYDRLFEIANAPHRTALRVLPYESVDHRHPWLLKLHGTTLAPGESEPTGEDIVLTRTDYARFDLRWRALASIVETLLVTRHMLFVGFSLDDPNFQRMVDTVRRAVLAADDTPGDEDQRIGTILEVNPTPYLAQVWSDEFHVAPMGLSRDDSVREQARLLEVFLDRVAAFAYPRSAYLLDPDAVGLLDEEELALKAHLVELIDALEGDPRFTELLRLPHAERHPALSQVRELLGQLGWRAARKPSKPIE
jgi:hypothetical protein